MLGKEVRKVLRAKHLPQLKVAPPEALLQPQGLAVKMPQLAQTLPRGSAYSCRAVGPYADGQLKAGISA